MKYLLGFINWFIDNENFSTFEVSEDDSVVAVCSNYKDSRGQHNQIIQIWLHFGGGSIKKFKEISIEGKKVKNAAQKERGGIYDICIGLV